MTIQIEALYANMHEEKEQLEQGEQETILPYKKALVTKDHIDEVD